LAGFGKEIQSLLYALGSSILFDEEPLNMIHNLVTTIEPVKITVKLLNRRETTLLSTDTTISFMFTI
jgi:hypothetical protein